MADAHAHPLAGLRRAGQPVRAPGLDAGGAQRRPGADDDRAVVGPDLHDVHRLGEAPGQPLPLADGEVGVALVAADLLTVLEQEGPRRERRVVLAQVPPEHAPVVVVGDEADLERLGLVGGAQLELAGHPADLVLPDLAHGEHQPLDGLRRDRPQEVGLVLVVVLGPQDPGLAVVAAPHAGVVAGGHEVAAEGVGAAQQVAELREAVAPDAGDGRPAGGVLRDEVVDDVPGERLLGVVDEVGEAHAAGDGLRVGDPLQAAAGVLGAVHLRVAEGLDGGARHPVAGPGQQGRGDAGVDAPRHGGQDGGGPLPDPPAEVVADPPLGVRGRPAAGRRRRRVAHARAAVPPRSRAAARTVTSAARSTSSSSVAGPRLNRSTA